MDKIFYSLMKHFDYSLLMSIVCVSTMLFGCKNHSDVELTERTKKIIELYIETTDDTDDPIYVQGFSSKNLYFLDIFAFDTACIHIDGYYYGTTFVRNRRIEVWGDLCNCFFWKPKRKPYYVPPKDNECYGEPCYWYLTVKKADTTIVENNCDFYCDIDFPIDTFNTLLKQ